MTELYEKNKLAFWIALIYIGLGTISICSVYPADLLSGDWTIWGILITFPVVIISFGFRYAEADILYPVFIIQTVMFMLTFWILKSLIKKRKKSKSTAHNKN